MKNLIIKTMVLISAILLNQGAQATPAEGKVKCKGGNFNISVAYHASIYDGINIELKIYNMNAILLDAFTDEQGNSGGFIHNAYTTETEVDSNNNIISEGSGVGPTRILAFLGSGQTPKLLEIDLERNTISINGTKKAKLSCRKF